MESSQNGNYWTSVGTPRFQHSIIAKALIRNVGMRAAYVKGVGYEGIVLHAVNKKLIQDVTSEQDHGQYFF